MLRGVTQALGSLLTYRIGIDAYDSTKLGLGPMMMQQAGSGESAWAGPCTTAVARPNEQSTAIPSVFPWAVQWQANSAGELDWIFFADNAAAAATRRISMYTFNRRTAVLNWQGFVTLTYPTATNHTIRGLRMTYDTYAVGTVAVTGTAVTGTGSLWTTSRIPAGCRIGFGSTDPTQITTWYEISAVASDTSITLTSTIASTLAAGTAYVIEDLRAITVTTNATTTNGGLFVAKGLRPEIFTSSGTTIAAATTVDSIRAVYWLADASTVTNTVAFGMGLDTKTSWTSQFAYVLDALTTPSLFKYNIRAALTLTSGKDTTSFVLKSGAAAALTGTPGQNNNGRLITAAHGPGSGQACMYFTTTTRIYRSIAVGSITSGLTTWLSGGDVMTEVPPGGTNTFAASSLMSSIEYASIIDKFVIPVNATTTPFRSYVTAYNTVGSQMDRIWGTDNRQQDLTTADSSISPIPAMVGGPYTVWAEGGMLYVATLGTTSVTNRIYAMPFGADWEYTGTTSARLVLPAITPDDMDKALYAFVAADQIVGTGSTGKNLAMGTEPWRLLYRTSGISDNSGAWTQVDGTGVLNATATQIQFALEFRTIGECCIPARICTVGLVYSDNATDSHYQFSATKSSASLKQFAWRFSTAFGSTVPTLKVRLFDAVTNALLLTDTTTTSASGTFQRSTDGTSWGAYSTADKGNENTYIRYTPTSLADNINVRPVLSLA